MRWRELISRKASQARITTEAWLPEPGGGLILVDDSIASTEAATAIVRVKGGLHNCG
jgi:hypothetical protein